MSGRALGFFVGAKDLGPLRDPHNRPARRLEARTNETAAPVTHTGRTSSMDDDAVTDDLTSEDGELFPQGSVTGPDGRSAASRALRAAVRLALGVCFRRQRFTLW